MKGSRVVLGLVLAAVVVLAAFVGTRPDNPSDSGGPKGSRPTESPVSATPTKGPSSSAPSDDPTTESPGSSGSIRLENLTSGQLSKEAPTASLATSGVTIPAHSLVLVHLMSCCDLASVPSVTGAGLTFDLAVTHTDGEKRHWVLVAANTGGPTEGTLTFSFASEQARILWIVDSATNVELGNSGADAIVQTAWQNSQQNADQGSIGLEPFEDPTRDVAMGFGLAGSGTATDIVPEAGMHETAETETPGSSLLIDTFWGVGEDTSVSAVFVDDAGQRSVESWLFLALELRAG